MNNDQGNWVPLPQFLFLDKTTLKYQDTLIYLTLRSYYNTGTKECFPAIVTIAEKSGVSRDFVLGSIKRLNQSGVISVETTRKLNSVENNSNRYSFEEFHVFEQIPLDFFTKEDLTYSEKGMLLCVRQFFNHGVLSTAYSMKKMAELLGIVAFPFLGHR